MLKATADGVCCRKPAARKTAAKKPAVVKAARPKKTAAKSKKRPAAKKAAAMTPAVEKSPREDIKKDRGCQVGKEIDWFLFLLTEKRLSHLYSRALTSVD